jgi:hypothetical protein
LLQHGELPPVIDPPLHGVPLFAGPEPDHFEPFASEPLSPRVPPELSERARGTVLQHEALKQHLEGKRFEWIGLSALDDKAVENGREAGLLAVLYSYADDRAIEVRLDSAGEVVHDVAHLAYQPPPTQDEIQRAIDFAKSDQRLAGELGDDLVGTAILVSSEDPNSPSFRHRLFDVRFGCPCERLPRLMGMVDLSRETVTSVGSCCPDDLAHAPTHEGVQP